MKKGNKTKILIINAVVLLTLATLIPATVTASGTVSGFVTVVGKVGGAAEVAGIGYHVAEMGPDIARAYIKEKEREKAMEEIMDDAYPDDDDDDDDGDDATGDDDDNDEEDGEEGEEEDEEDDEPEEQDEPEETKEVIPAPIPPVPMPYVDPETGETIFPDWPGYDPKLPSQ